MEGFLLTVLKEGGVYTFLAIIIFWLVRLERVLNKIQEEFISKSEFNKLEQRVEQLSQEAQRKEDFYRDISGWREDIRYLSEKIDKMLMEVLRKHVS